MLGNWLYCGLSFLKNNSTNFCRQSFLGWLLYRAGMDGWLWFFLEWWEAFTVTALHPWCHDSLSCISLFSSFHHCITQREGAKCPKDPLQSTALSCQFPLLHQHSYQLYSPNSCTSSVNPAALAAKVSFQRWMRSSVSWARQLSDVVVDICQPRASWLIPLHLGQPLVPYT